MSSRDEQKKVQQWGRLFDLAVKSHSATPAQPGRNFIAWKDSRTGKQIPTEQMEEWAELTMQRILALNPSSVLEIGCGNGLILLRVAPLCKRYVGGDVSPFSLKSTRDQMETMVGTWSGVELLERPADNFAGFEENEFDTIVINSVIQYFPSLDYLDAVLGNAVRVAQPGGAIFIGDVRNSALVEDCASFIELSRASPELTVGEFRQRIAKRIARDPELLVHPEFFAELRKRNPKISRTEVLLKPGRSDNELTRFRYDAILHL